MNDTEQVLMLSLAIAVPLRIAELTALPDKRRWPRIRAWADAAVDIIACEGDTLQYGSKPGDAARVFDHLARGVAALAMAPGGVTFHGTHWCLEHPWSSTRDPTTLTCATSGTGPSPRQIVTVHATETYV